VQISAGTHAGLLRPINEDSYCYCPAPDRENCCLIVVADGMGGHKAGEVASKMAITILEKLFLSLYPNLVATDFLQMEKTLTEMVATANRKIYKASVSNEEYRGMGTTLTMGIIIDDYLWVAHVGDSRAYLVRNGVITKLTEDHSLVGELVTKGELTEREASSHPHRNILTRALGSAGEITVDIRYTSILKDDIIIFTTDGLTNLLSSEEINQVVGSSFNFSQAAQELILLANERGGPDNITVVLVRY